MNQILELNPRIPETLENLRDIKYQLGSNALVTVITPIHNSAPWLDETIMSVRNQTLDLKYILVDDGSTDDSLEIAKRHAAEDPRLTVDSVKFGSVSHTRQFGIGMVETPFTAFLDGDDVWHPNFLERSLEQFKLDEKAIAVYGLFGLINEHSEKIELPKDSSKGVPQQNITGKVDFDGYLLGDTPARTASAVTIRTSALQGHAFLQEFEPCEDYELWLRILNDNPGGYFYGINEELFDYRIRQDQQTSNTQKIFEKLDKMYAKYVPKMRSPKDRWQVYEAGRQGALARGCPEFVEHFGEMVMRLKQDSEFVPHQIKV